MHAACVPRFLVGVVWGRWFRTSQAQSLDIPAYFGRSCMQFAKLWTLMSMRPSASFCNPIVQCLNFPQLYIPSRRLSQATLKSLNASPLISQRFIEVVVQIIPLRHLQSASAILEDSESFDAQIFWTFWETLQSMSSVPSLLRIGAVSSVQVCWLWA